MLKRELKITRKGLIIWTSICIILFGLSYIVYPSIMNNDNSSMLNDMMELFPPEMLKMFNMDIANINTVFGWFKTEGYTILILLLGVYSSMLGSNILLKEESDKTIEFLYSKPINRNSIIISKVLAGLINIFFCVLIIGVFNFCGMAISNDLEVKTLLLLSISPLLVCLPLFFISLFISTFFNKTKKTYSLGIGISFVAYFMQMLSSLGDKVEYLKYFSLFTLSDSRNIIVDGNISIVCIFISIMICTLSFIFISINYNKKELV